MPLDYSIAYIPVQHKHLALGCHVGLDPQSEPIGVGDTNKLVS